MSILTKREIRLILEVIGEKVGFGYSKDRRIAALQAKLSIMLEMAPEDAQPPKDNNMRNL